MIGTGNLFVLISSVITEKDCLLSKFIELEFPCKDLEWERDCDRDKDEFSFSLLPFDKTESSLFVLRKSRRYPSKENFVLISLDKFS